MPRPCPWIAPVAFALGLTACVRPPPAEAPNPDSEALAPAEPAGPLWAGRGPGELYRLGEVRGFKLLQAGREFGASYGRYLGPDPSNPDQYVFETRIEMNIPGGRSLRSEGRVIVDGSGHLVSGYERSDAAEIRFAREGETLELQSGGTKDTLTYAPSTIDTAFMAHSAIFHEELMLGLREIDGEKLEWRLVSLSGGVPVQWEATIEAPTPDREFITLRTNLGEDIRVKDGRIDRVLVPADKLEIRSMDTAPAWPTWEISGPRKLTYAKPPGAMFEIREVELPGRGGDAKLVGEVLVPKGAKKTPAVLFLSGGGQQDRYGFAGPPPIDVGSHAITDALAEAGLVVLRYDEAGFGGSDKAPLSFTRQLEDARRGLRTLLVQDEVDPSRILVVAHGEGGWRGLLLAANRPREVKGVALLASPGRRYRKVMEQQAQVNLQRVPPDLRPKAKEEHTRMLNALESGGAVPPELAGQAKWVREVMKVDPAALVDGAKCPLFFAQGGKDFEVNPSADLDALVRAARKARRRFTVKRYPELDHHFVFEPETSEPERYLEAGRKVDEAFLADLVSWAKKASGLR